MRSDGPSDDDLREIVSRGIMAPSGGNCQPWKFIWRNDERLECIHDVSRSASFLDFQHRATHLSFGAAVENMSLAAGTFGFHTEIASAPANRSALVCELTFHRTASRSSPIVRYINERATNRKLGSRKPLSHDEETALRSAAASRGAELQLVTNDRELEAIGAVIGAGDRFRFFSRRLFHEMMSELRWSDDEAKRTRDGIHVDTLELSGLQVLGLRLMSSWASVRFLRFARLGRTLEILSRRAVRASSAVGLITVEGSGVRSYFSGGRAMEQLWLTTTGLGLAFQPVTVLLYLFARMEDAYGFTKKEIETLHALRERFGRIFRVSQGTGEVLLFRVARTGPPSARSLRRDIDDMLEFE